MKKLNSLLKACMTSDMQIFKIKSKNNSPLVPLFFAGFFAFYMFMLSNAMLDSLLGTNVEYVFISLVVILTAFLTVAEGIYKAGNLLFNCKDDDLLLSLPISRRTVLFVRVFKFYTFELLYNSLYLVPAMIAYAVNVEVGMTYYITSFLMIFLLPIIPIVISSIIGFITTGLSSRFKFKNFAQIVFSMSLLLVVLYASLNLESIVKQIAENATSINEIITKLYYPAGVYVNAITKFNLIELLIFILVNIVLFVLMIVILSKVYFKINSRLKKVIKTDVKHSNGKITYKANGVTTSLIKKELNRFFKTPVFIINAGFGLVLFIIICLVAVFKIDIITAFMINNLPEILTVEDATNKFPFIVLALILFGTLTTSITSSLISLEGKNINILKSLPIDPRTIIMSKVYAGLVIMLPAILIGTAIVLIKFKISIIESLLLLVIAIILSLVSCIIGIIVNLKYPKLDAENDTEVVKQSTSSMVSVFAGFFFLGVSMFLVFSALAIDIPVLLLLIAILAIYSIILLILMLYLRFNGVKLFNKLLI